MPPHEKVLNCGLRTPSGRSLPGSRSTGNATCKHWRDHRSLDATNGESGAEVFHEIIKAHVRGKRLIPLRPGFERFRATSPAEADPPHLAPPCR